MVFVQWNCQRLQEYLHHWRSLTFGPAPGPGRWCHALHLPDRRIGFASNTAHFRRRSAARFATCWNHRRSKTEKSTCWENLPNVLVMTNSLLLKMTIEIVDVPINSMVIVHSYVNVYQRLMSWSRTIKPRKKGLLKTAESNALRHSVLLPTL